MGENTTHYGARRRRVTLSRLPRFSAQRLQALRLNRDLSLRDLADLARCTTDAVRKWEAGAMTPDPRRARRLADALQVSLQDLTDLRDDEIGLAESRALHGLTARDLANLTGIDRSSLSRIELGDRRPNHEQAEALATGLGLTADQVIELWERMRARRLDDVRSRAQRDK